MTTLGLILIVLASLAGLVGSVWLIVEAFRVEIKWGLIALFVPFGAFVFCFAHWQEAKKPFLVSLSAVVLIPLGMIAVMGGAVSQAGAAFEQAAVQAAATQARRPAAAPVAKDLSVAEEGTPAVAAPGPAAESAGQSDEADSPTPTTVAGSIAQVLRLPKTDESRAGQLEPVSVITFARVDEHVGETLNFVRANGRSFCGELISVEGEKLQVRRRLRGGSVVYPVTLSELREVRPMP